MRTLKEEEVDGRACRNVAEAPERIGAFIEEVYNRRRLHSVLGYSVSHRKGAVHAADRRSAADPMKSKRRRAPHGSGVWRDGAGVRVVPGEEFVEAVDGVAADEAGDGVAHIG